MAIMGAVAEKPRIDEAAIMAVLENVMDPAAVQSDINRRFAARKAKNEQQQIAKERERMAEWLATYHLNSESLRDEQERKTNQKPE